MSLRSFFTGVVVGSIIAGSSVLLTTPESGRKVRSNVKQEAAEWKVLLKTVQERAVDIKAEVMVLADEGRKAVQIISQEVKPAIVQWKNSSNPSITNIQKEVQEIQHNVEQLENTINQK